MENGERREHIQHAIRKSRTRGPSPASFDAHIQLHDALMSSSLVIFAHTMLVSASPAIQGNVIKSREMRSYQLE